MTSQPNVSLSAAERACQSLQKGVADLRRASHPPRTDPLQGLTVTPPTVVADYCFHLIELSKGLANELLELPGRPDVS